MTIRIKPKSFKEGILWLLAYHTKKACIILFLLAVLIIIWKLTCTFQRNQEGHFVIEEIKLKAIDIPIKEFKK